MSKLSPDARHLLDEARAGLDPPPQARDRVRARVLARVGAAAAVGSAAALGSSATAAKTAAAGILVKIAAFVVIAGVAAAVTVAVDSGRTSTVPASTTAPVLAAPPAPPRPLPARAPEPADTVEAAPPPAAVPTPRPAAPHASAPSPAASASLDEETNLLQKAQAELRAGHPERALATLDDHEGSGGVLRDERRAERILALCAAGRTDEARAEARRFLAESPRSPMAARVRSSCAASERP